MVIGHSGGMWLTDRAFLQTHVTFCEYLVSTIKAKHRALNTISGTRPKAAKSQTNGQCET